MRPALISRTKRRGAAALATALRLFFLTASDMWHPCGGLTRNWSALDRDCAANTCHDIEWDDRRWNGCASSLLSYSADRPRSAFAHFVRAGYFGASLWPVHKGVLLLRTCPSLLVRCHCAGRWN